MILSSQDLIMDYQQLNML